jgi:hypothetical protein
MRTRPSVRSVPRVRPCMEGRTPCAPLRSRSKWRQGWGRRLGPAGPTCTSSWTATMATAGQSGSTDVQYMGGWPVECNWVRIPTPGNRIPSPETSCTRRPSHACCACAGHPEPGWDLLYWADWIGPWTGLEIRHPGRRNQDGSSLPQSSWTTARDLVLLPGGYLLRVGRSAACSDRMTFIVGRPSAIGHLGGRLFFVWGGWAAVSGLGHGVGRVVRLFVCWLAGCSVDWLVVLVGWLAVREGRWCGEYPLPPVHPPAWPWPQGLPLSTPHPPAHTRGGPSPKVFGPCTPLAAPAGSAWSGLRQAGEINSAMHSPPVDPSISPPTRPTSRFYRFRALIPCTPACTCRRRMVRGAELWRDQLCDAGGGVGLRQARAHALSPGAHAQVSERPVRSSWWLRVHRGVGWGRLGLGRERVHAHALPPTPTRK